MRSRFRATLHPDGRASLEIVSPAEVVENRTGIPITDESAGIDPAHLTPEALQMLARAYEAGHWHGLADAKRAMLAAVPTLETTFAKPPSPRYPNPDINRIECQDWRQKEATDVGIETTLGRALRSKKG